jgi:tetratricopeptide (TPR) repeat protein
MNVIGDTLGLSRIGMTQRRAHATTLHLALTGRLARLEAQAVQAELAGGYRRAARLRKRCVATELKLGRPAPLAQQYYKFGLALRALGRHKAAIKALSSAVDIGRANAVDVLAADAQLAIAGVMLMAQEIDQARAAAMAAELFYRRLAPDDDGPTPAERLLNTIAAMQQAKTRVEL